MWSDAIMNQPGLPGVRGVGGRLMFYGESDDKPLSVNGTLSVYAYDDAVENDQTPTPARKFVFLPEQFKERASQTNLGQSYNVWLPWDEVGNPARQLTLVARFEPLEGAVVLSEPSRQLLPGTSTTPVVEKNTRETSVQRDLGVQPASFASSPLNEDSMEAFTIDVPGDVARRWAQGGVEGTASSTYPGTLSADEIASATSGALGGVSQGVDTAQAPVSQANDSARIESAAPVSRQRMTAPRRVPNPSLNR
ncbi:MAG: hypothetical protein KDA61_10100 [Planctomycetales bacterium]|nr:hypothetical protein [Planctomycetales bacterium]